MKLNKEDRMLLFQKIRNLTPCAFECDICNLESCEECELFQIGELIDDFKHEIIKLLIKGNK